MDAKTKENIRQFWAPRTPFWRDEDCTVEDGIIFRWCYGSPAAQRAEGKTEVGGCRHAITTYEMTDQTDLCNQRFHQPEYLSWRMEKEFVPQETIVEYLLHQPHCKTCMAHGNSYGFPAWYTLKQSDVEELVELFIANFSKDLYQPFFYMWGDNNMNIRLHNTPNDVGDADGEIDLKKMEAVFIIEYTDKDKAPPGGRIDEEDEDSYYIEYVFDLNQPSEWQRILEYWPQDKHND